MSEDADGDIRRLDDRTIRQIAAGEVVERPASVVKELVENALDAGASRVAVAVERGGKDGIRVRDDGHGMTADELELAVEEHATSKIGDIDDLEAGVGTLGFRGEALHTVSAVSRTTIRSRPPDADRGHELVVEGGEVGEVRPVGCPPGTVVEVEDLFYNTPARRKFLKSDATEFDHVNTVVTQYALANPSVAVSLEHDGRETFATDGRGDLAAAVLAVYGREVAESMVEVERAGDGPVESVSGLVSHPETTRSGRDYLSTFINGRYVPATALREAVLDAYGGQLASDRYPFAVLFVDLPADAVDVNVHPRKMEVRFDDEAAVKRAVERAVEEALLDHGLIRSTAPRGRGAPSEAAVEPESRDEEARGGAGTDHERAAGVDRGPRRERPPTAVDEGAADAEEGTDEPGAESRATPADGAEPTPTDDVEATTPDDRETEDGETTTPGDREADEADSGGSAATGAGPGSPPESAGGTAVDDGSAEGGPSDAGRTPTPRRFQRDEPAGPDADGEPVGSDADAPGRDRRGGGVAPTSQRTLDGERAGVREFDALPRMRVLGQLHDTYVVAETPDGLVLVDQHAADERVNYERLRAELGGDTPTQALAEPVELELTAREAALFDEYADALASLGFHAGRTGERTVAVRSVPAVFDAALDPELLRDALTAFAADDETGGERTVEAVADDLLADLACYPSITGNTSLTEGSVLDLLAALDGCENPYACPHGRPTVVAIDEVELDERFERDYPGHGRRRDGA
ncbi:MAG: DNA mismatch repair endonuclease MutL [Haloferacaceae archaeon]